MLRKVPSLTGLVVLCLLFLPTYFPEAQAGVVSSRLISSDYLADIATDGLYNWPREKLPIKVFIEPGEELPGYRANFPDVLRQSFDDWMRASGNRLTWVQVDQSQSADIICHWSPDAPERMDGTEAGRTKTYARFNTETNRGTIYKVTMSLATRLPDREMTDDEIKKTVLHEVGHALGLEGHSPERSDIMFARVSPSQLPYLTDRDSATIVRLYSDYQPLAARPGQLPPSASLHSLHGESARKT